MPRPSRAESDARRSERTRTRLLDAALECLVELGYAGTTTVEICRRAGAPRGTLLHHYKSRDALMLAAVEHVLDRRLAELDAAFARMARSQPRGKLRPGDEVIDQLWKVASGPSMHAWLEVLVASRTNPTLRAPFKRQMAELNRRVRDTYRTWFGDEYDADVIVTFTFAVLNGLSLDRLYRPKHEVLPVLDVFKELARETLAEGAPR